MFQYRRNGNTARLSGGSEDSNEIVLNSRYLFYVGREAPFQPWTLRLVELDLASNTARKFQESGFDPLIVAPTSVLPLGSFLSQHRKPSSLADDQRFKLTKTERLPDDLVKVHYRYDHANYKLSGEFYCDPATHFVIRSGRSRHTAPDIEYLMTFERHFGVVGADGQVNVERLAYEAAGTPSKIGGHDKKELSYSYPDVRKTGELDEERFRLTAYGLPEPEGVAWKKPRRWLPYWLAGAGAFIILVTTLVIRRARRTHSREKQA